MYRYQKTVAALVVESGEKLEKSAKMNVSTGLLEDAGWGSRSLFSHSRSGLHLGGLFTSTRMCWLWAVFPLVFAAVAIILLAPLLYSTLVELHPFRVT